MLRSKNLTIVLSLLIAIVLWAYVIAFENPPTTERIRGVPVELLSVGMLAQNGWAILEGESATVDVVISGTRAEIARHKDQIIATANVFGYNRIGEHYVTVEVHPPGPLTVVEVRPAKILLSLDSLVAVHKPVIITFTGLREPNTEPGSMILQPEQIEISGPRSLVESVSYVGVKVPYAQLTREAQNINVVAFALDVNGEPVPRVKLSSDSVSVRAALHDVKEVPLYVDIIGEVAERFEMTRLDVPESIIIKGSKSALAEIESVEAEPINISDVIATSELLVVPILPEGVEIAWGSYNIHVSIGIKGISNKGFEYDSKEIEIRGAESGIKAYINTPTIKLSVAGTEAILDLIVKEDFALYVDIEDLEAGSHIVTVVVEHEQTLSSLTVIPNEVYITISEDT